MGTGYFNEIDIEITGTIDEDVDTKVTQLFRAQLSMLCAVYGLTWDDKKVDNAD